MPNVDRAGLKDVLLAYGNYTTYYVTKKALVSTSGKKVIPVVTQYSEKNKLFYYDSRRSMIGTYLIPTTGKSTGKSYFVQDVLCVPGLRSRELLKEATMNKYEFWDMALEMPTHPTVLTPSFQQLQPFQLLA